MARPVLEARKVLGRAKAELEALGEPWDGYSIDVELVGSVLFNLGVQRVPDLRVGQRDYAALLNGDARLIAVEEHHHEHRQRFSIAHEIGHFVMHYRPQSPGGGLFACSTADMEVRMGGAGASASAHVRREWEANLFAEELLMPSQAVVAMYRVTGGRLLSMARHFKVSTKAMEIRLSHLSLPF